MEEPGFFPTRVLIAGGRGRMGEWLARRLSERGCPVEVAERQEGQAGLAKAGDCPVVILAVPVGAVEEVMAGLAPHLPSSGLVMDICSLKQGPLASMLRHAPGQVLGCHPLFGPWEAQVEGQPVFLCPGREGPWISWARAFWAGLGARLVEMEPERHDLLMAQAQSLRHLWVACLGRALRETGFAPAQDLELAGPWFQSLWGVLENQARQPAELYAQLAVANPASGAAMRALAGAAQEMAARLQAGDGGGLAQAMNLEGLLAKE